MTHPAFGILLLGLLLSLGVYWKKSLRRALQVLSLSLFVALFWLAAFGGRPDPLVGLFLITDPLLALVHTLAGRVLVPLLLLSLVFVALAALLGRVFCSHVCPLGTLLDCGDGLLKNRKLSAADNHGRYRRVRPAKVFILLFVLAAGACGFNLLGLCDPIAIFTRFAATVFYPAILVLEDLSLLLVRPIGAALGWVDVAYAEVIPPAFEGGMLMVGLLLLLLLLGRLQSRFWCRHLCPLGAMLGWVGRWAPYRRRVGEACNACDKCVRECPTGAIHPEGKNTDRGECIVCQRCVEGCPVKAVRFGFSRRDAGLDLAGPGLSRRGFLGGVASGLASGLALRTDVLHPSHQFLPLALRDPGLIRPPGAIPEPEFLARCVRCGECLRACLTNTLQPDWYRAGLEGLWAPRMNLRRAACEQTCNVCGQVCPTQAIRPLDLKEKQHAKVGTAVLCRDSCLPWSQEKRCLVCDEQCPYNAIVFIQDPGHKVPLPVVLAQKCNGCGQCEDKCPVLGGSAIVVTPQGELRLGSGSYVEECRTQGLLFEAKDQRRDTFEVEEEPETGSKLPPGITPEE